MRPPMVHFLSLRGHPVSFRFCRRRIEISATLTEVFQLIEMTTYVAE